MIPIEDLTDVTLVSDDTYEDLTDITLAIEEVLKVIKWRKSSSDESYQVMKVIMWWKLCSDGS